MGKTAVHKLQLNCEVKLFLYPGWGGGVLPYMVYIGMCCCGEEHGFQTVYSRIGYIDQSVWYHFSRN